LPLLVPYSATDFICPSSLPVVVCFLFVFNYAAVCPRATSKDFQLSGWVVGLSEGGSLPSGVGGVSSKAVASIFVPSIAVPSRPPRSFSFSQIYRPSVPPSLSLSLVPTSPMMRRMMNPIMATPARRARVRH
jgi:hypothetical protein